MAHFWICAPAVARAVLHGIMPWRRAAMRWWRWWRRRRRRCSRRSPRHGRPAGRTKAVQAARNPTGSERTTDQSMLHKFSAGDHVAGQVARRRRQGWDRVRGCVHLLQRPSSCVVHTECSSTAECAHRAATAVKARPAAARAARPTCRGAGRSATATRRCYSAVPIAAGNATSSCPPAGRVLERIYSVNQSYAG